MLTKLISLSTSEESENGDCDCNGSPTTNQASKFSSFTTTYLELTPVCNNRCLGCSNVFINDKLTRKMNLATAPLSITEWRKIIRKLSAHVGRLSITGGEPTLYKHFTEFTQLLDEYQLDFTLFTNARWNNPEATVKAFQRTKQLKGLLISLHGQDAPTHEAFTLIPGSFAETIENIKLATQAGISVTLSTIITRYSFIQSQAVYQLGQELGVRQVVFNRYVGLPKDDCAPTPAQLRQALTDIEAMRVQGAAVKLSVTVPQCFHPTSATGCGAGEIFITVDPWGNVKPCNHTPMIVGNLRYDSVENIMASSQLDYWRNLPLASCKDCSAVSMCGGGCRAEAMLNRNTHDSLMTQLIPLGDQTHFFILPDYLRPIATHTFAKEDFVDEINLQWRDILLTSLDGKMTLKDLGIKHGQAILDVIGTMHREGVVEFV
jgi:radical SAM protein with 4Fe4S-binding SPASM domain